MLRFFSHFKPSALPPWNAFSRLATTAAVSPAKSAPITITSKKSRALPTPADAKEEEGAARSVLVDVATQDLDASHIGRFYKLQTDLLPEVMSASVSSKKQSATSTRSCPGLQDEVAASRVPAIMLRDSMYALRGTMRQDGIRLLLKGPTGTGKSIALASIVDWARACGWIVMYIPTATALTHGGFFVRRPESGVFDTILSAQQILRSLVLAHGKQLSSMQRKLFSPVSGKTLLELANAGLATESNASLAVDACLSIKEELVAATLLSDSAASLSELAPKVLFAFDDYNSLYWQTGYGRDDGEGKRVPLEVDDLVLAKGMRLLRKGAELGNACVVAAASGSRGVPEKSNIPVAANVNIFHMPRYSEVEVGHALHWYWENGLAAAVPTTLQVRCMHAITNGNAKEVRQMAPKMSLISSGMI